jgi:hypothetical protein
LKLHELVFINYNLRLRIQRATVTPEPSEFDPILAFMDLSLHRHNEVIRDWMERGDPMHLQHWMKTHLSVTLLFLACFLHRLYVNKEAQRKCKNGPMKQLVTPTLVSGRQDLVHQIRKEKMVKITDQIEEEEEDEDSDDNTTDPSAGDDGSHGDAGL